MMFDHVSCAKYAVDMNILPLVSKTFPELKILHLLDLDEVLLIIQPWDGNAATFS